MKFFQKDNLPNGRTHIYFCGIKIASYKKTYKPQGINNKIINPQKNCRCYIYGNNNEIIFGKDVDWFGTITIGYPDAPANNCIVNIGNKSKSNGVEIQICENNTRVEIGPECLFSWGINMWASDTHSITDLDGKIINIGKYIKIGSHVWIGMGATILKNTIIPDNCIIGTQSVVCGKFQKSNCVIAGNPGKVVKENINWNHKRPNQYTKD